MEKSKTLVTPAIMYDKIKSLLIVCFVISGLNLLAQGNDSNGVNRTRTPESDKSKFLSNELLIKFRDNVTLTQGNRTNTVGLDAVDKIFTDYEVYQLNKVFPNAVKKNSKTTIKSPDGSEMEVPNLHNIYKIVFRKDRFQSDSLSLMNEVMEKLRDLPDVEYVEPNFVYSIGGLTPQTSQLEGNESLPSNSITPETTAFVPNDPLYNQQWGIPATYINNVWNSYTGNGTSIIAILDTGVDWGHPDLMNNIWSNDNEIPGNGIDDDGNGFVDDIMGWDYINNDNNPMDDNSHGTHCAGIAAAQGNNGIGIAGVNWHARIMPVKVFQSSGSGDVATIAQGVIYAANEGATVLSMSFGSYAESLTLENALINASATAILVAAAGNDAYCIGPGYCPGGPHPFYPAAYSFILGVIANSQTSPADFTNYDLDGPVASGYLQLLNYELAAPGVDIISCIPGGNYCTYSGTSMSAPLVAGAVSIYNELKSPESFEMIFGQFIYTSEFHFNLENAINAIPQPALTVVSYQVIDTLSGDSDGKADAGEVIEIDPFVRNTWGLANNVKVGIRFAEFEDPTTASLIITESIIGSLSSYATLSPAIPLKLQISPSVVNGRDICFELYTVDGQSVDTSFYGIVITVENGEELTGMISDTIVLTPDKLWMINSSFRLTPTGVMILEPGTHLVVTTKIINDGTIIANGTADSATYITSPRISGGVFRGNHLNLNITGEPNLYSPNFSPYGGGWLSNSRIIINAYYGIETFNFSFTDCIFEQCRSKLLIYGCGININRCNFIDLLSWDNYPSTILSPEHESCITIRNCNFTRTFNFNFFTGVDPITSNCNFLDEYNKTFLYGVNYQPYSYYPNNYWGYVDPEKISNKIYDFFDDASLSIVDYDPILQFPSDSAHACVWRILIDDNDPQAGGVDPLGTGVHKFEVWFNKPMDTSYTPVMSFGVRYPYVQNAINDSSEWSSDHKVWTAWETITPLSGDGINRARVSEARDLDGWVIPVESERFEFLIQSAGSQSVNFTATPGQEKIDLQWSEAHIDDLLGYNLYRYENLTDTTFSLPVIVNNTLILDTVFTDLNLIPDQRYYYYYKILRTNLTESDSSKTVSAIPLPINTQQFNIVPEIRVYPNPGNGVFNIAFETSKPQQLDIEIYNMLGSLVWQKKNVQINGITTIVADISKESKGIYSFLLKNDDGMQIMKVVRE